MSESQATTLTVEVFCDAERKVVGHLHLVPGPRPKVMHASLVWETFRPVDNKYRLSPKTARAGEYWHCPLCQGHLCLRGTKKTGEAYPPGHPSAGKVAPPVQDALAPVVLGRTQVQVG